MRQSQLIRCPFCAEEIRAEMKKCQFCGEWITSDDKMDGESAGSSPVPNGIENRGGSEGQRQQELKEKLLQKWKPERERERRFKMNDKWVIAIIALLIGFGIGFFMKPVYHVETMFSGKAVLRCNTITGKCELYPFTADGKNQTWMELKDRQ